jgi:hypothetical protein
LLSAPLAPTNLTATAPSCSEVDLRWTVSTGAVSGYNVYRKASTATAFTLMKQVGATPVFPVADAAASGSTTYTYGVAAWNSAGTSTMPTVLTNTPACSTPTGALRWAKSFGGAAWDNGEAVAIDGAGNTVVTGTFSGTVNFGGGPLTSAGTSDVFVAKYGPDGSYVWSIHASAPSTATPQGIVVDRNGDVIVTGYFNGTADFGGGSLTSAGSADIFVAKYSGPTGAHEWSKRFGSIDADYGRAVTVDASNNVVVTGSFADAVDFGGGWLVGGRAAYVVTFSPAGTHLSSWVVPGTSTYGWAIAIDGGGNVILGGSFLDSLHLGSSVFYQSSPTRESAFIAKYTPAGVAVWGRSFDQESLDYGTRGGVAVDAGSNVLVVGTFVGTVDFGTGSLTALNQDAFIAKYSPTGVPQWARRLGSTGSDGASGIAVDASGNYAVLGTFSGTVDFGGGPIAANSNNDVFVAKYSSTGGYLWSHHFGNTSASMPNPVAMGGAGNACLTGNFTGTLDGASLVSAGSADAFLVCFAP